MGRGLLATFGLVAVLSTGVRAAEPSVRRTGLHRQGNTLHISVGAQDVVHPADLARLSSGFAHRVMLRVALYRVGERSPLAEAVRHSEIVFDLWEERYRVRRWRPGDTSAEWTVTPDVRQAVEFATTLWLFPAAELSTLRPGAAYRFSFRADLNPISEEMVADVKRSLVRPQGAGRSTSGDGFFGSFVSLFVNPRVEESERSLSFHSQAFAEPVRAPLVAPAPDQSPMGIRP